MIVSGSIVLTRQPRMSSSQRPRSVALFSPGWPPGRVSNGIVTYVGHLAPALERLGVRTSIIIPSQIGPSSVPTVDLSKMRRPRLRDLCLRAIRKIPGYHSEGLRLGWAVGQAASDIAAQSGLDLLEMEESFGGAWYAQQLLDIPVVARLHGPRFLNGAALGLPIDAAFRQIDQAERRCIAQVTGVTAPSRDVLARARHHYELPLADALVIPYPGPMVRPDRRWRLEESDRKSILFVGRFDRHKGGDVMIDAFREVAAKLPEAELLFVGIDRGFRDDVGRTHRLPDYLEAHLPAEVRSRVRVFGELGWDRIETLRRQAFVTVVPSRYETFGFTVAESLAFGCPTVAADAGAIPEVLLDEQTGLLFRAGEPSDLASKIVALFAHPERAAQFGRAGAADVNHRLDPDLIARTTLDYYHVLWSRRRRTQARHRPWRVAYKLTGLL
jgi:glycosyltransferase involved in cell wall biosynthesis